MSKQFQSLTISKLADMHNTLSGMRTFIVDNTSEAYQHIVNAQQEIEAAIGDLATSLPRPQPRTEKEAPDVQ